MQMSRSRILAAATALALVLAACGGNAAPGGEPGNGPGEPGVVEGETVDSVIIDQDSEPEPVLLRGGRYRVAWRHTDCPEGINIVLNKVGDLADADPEDRRPFEYQRAQRVPQFNTLVQNVPAGAYEFTQTNEDCATWEIRADRVGN
jgi:hypothetical protein